MRYLTKLAILAFAGLSLSTATALAEDCHFNWVVGQGFTLECDGNSITIPGTGGLPGGNPPPETPQVCFYDQPNFTGTSICVSAGTSDGNVTGIWDNRVTSIRLIGGAKVRLFQDHGFCGNRNVFVNDVPHLGAMLNNRASAYQTWTGAAPAIPPCTGGSVTPHTMSTGPVTLQVGHWVDLENGSVGAVVPITPPTADFFYERPNPAHHYLKPINGAQFARGDMSNRGLAGCSIATFSASRIPVPAMPVGSYICVKTQAGHISQFRVNAVLPNTVQLGYTTWSN